ncbi:MAG TPA: DUF1080 domain-containing protein [Cytophagaceae bacterium]|jgi:hypothetical protein
MIPRNFIVTSVLITALLISYSIKSNAQKSSKPQPANTLTSQEKKDGWILLFDGKTLANWKGFKKDSIGSGWQVENGTLHFNGTPGSGDIVSKGEYQNFELQLEWKIAKNGNSGIFYYVAEAPEYNATYETGLEMQILDDDGHPDAKNGVNDNRKAATLYDMIPAPKAVLNKVGEQYNKVVIKANNGHVEHWINGQKVVEFQKGSKEWTALVEGSKFNGWKGFGKYDKGHIALQDHGDKIWFRNIKIKVLK